VNSWNGIFQPVPNNGILVPRFPGGSGIGKRRILIYLFLMLSRKKETGTVVEHREEDMKRGMGKRGGEWANKLFAVMRLFALSGFLVMLFKWNIHTLGNPEPRNAQK